MKQHKLPEFNDEEQEWMERALVVMEPKLAMGAFLKNFPRFFDQGLHPGEVKERIYTRFKQAKYDKTRPAYHVIQRNIEELHEVLRKYTTLYPVTDPFERLNVLEQMRQNPDAINSKLLRVMEIGARIFEKQTKIERDEYATEQYYRWNNGVDSASSKDEDGLPEKTEDQEKQFENDPKNEMEETENPNPEEEEENHLF